MVYLEVENLTPYKGQYFSFNNQAGVFSFVSVLLRHLRVRVLYLMKILE